MKTRVLNAFTPPEDPWEGISFDPDPTIDGTVEQAFEEIRRGFFPKQEYHYEGVRYLTLSPMFEKLGRSYPFHPTTAQIEKASRWLDSPSEVGSGRSTLLAVCYLEAALVLRNRKIRYHDHRGGGSRQGEAVYKAALHFLDTYEVFRDRVCLVERGFISASEKGSRDLFNMGTL